MLALVRGYCCAVGKSEGQRHVGVQKVAAGLARAGGQREIFVIADGEIDFDGIELRDGGQYGLRTHQIADLHGGLPRHAADQRANLR